MTYQHMEEIDFSVYPIYNDLVDAIDYHELCVNALTMYLNEFKREMHEELNEE